MDKNELPMERPPMGETEFAHHLSGLVAAALTGGQVSFGQVVSTLEFAKSDVIEMARAQAQQPPPEPLIVEARNLPPTRNGG